MPLHLFDGRFTSTTPRLASQRRRTSPGMSENKRYWSTGCQIGPSVNSKPVPVWPTGAYGSIRSSNSDRKVTCVIGCVLVLRREPVARRQALHDRAGHLVMQPTDHGAAFDLGRPVVNRQQIARAAQELFDRGLFRPLAGAVVAGGARLGVMDLVEGRHDL